MSRPPKSIDVVTGHRTKKEIQQQKKAEEALRTTPLKERPEVKGNPVAHKEFMRINKLLKELGKNDALFESVINRYCELQSEVLQLKQEREILQETVLQIRETFDCLKEDLAADQRVLFLIDLTKQLVKLSGEINRVDGNIQSKRKMLFDIEKENIFTISAALRTIPKKEVKEENPLLKALKGEDDSDR